ncbi:N-acylneuraminate-9-phosphatase isoform X2 [Euwallacea fornicatus]|uniref:N-acylneuraminate-9-phosphatase isoform X2 n=1 Tax=Euwallacea fornicatus TaxID=995702 RepID=UPI00338E813D
MITEIMVLWEQERKWTVDHSRGTTQHILLNNLCSLNVFVKKLKGFNFFVLHCLIPPKNNTTRDISMDKNKEISLIKCILFDLDNTLIETREADARVCEKIAKDLILKYSLSNEEATSMAANFLSNFRRCPENKLMSLDQWRTHLWSQALGEKYQEDAGDLSYEKPDKNIFFQACEILNVNPKNCLMVGDKLETDIEGGLQAGLAGTVWIPLNRHYRLTDDDPKPDYVLKSIMELKDLLRKLEGSQKWSNELKYSASLRQSNINLEEDCSASTSFSDYDVPKLIFKQFSNVFNIEENSNSNASDGS